MKLIEHSGPLKTWQALTVGALSALLLITIGELFQIPLHYYRNTPVHGPKLIFLILDGNMRHLFFPLLFLGWLGAMSIAFQSRYRLHPAHVVINTVLGAAVTWSSYRVLIQHVPFEGYLPIIILFVLAWLAIAALTPAFFHTGDYLAPSWKRTALRFGVPAVYGIGGIALHVLNQILFNDTYPTLHLAALQLTFIFLSGAVALLLTRFSVPVPAFRTVRWVVALAALHLAVLAPFVADLPWSAPSKSLYGKFTMPGQSEVVGKNLLLVSEEKVESIPADPTGVERFERMSRMPALPADFSLEKYNVLWITTESLRYDQTSLYSKELKTTPRLLELVNSDRAYSFDSAWAPAMKTMNAISSILSMTYPSFAHMRLTRNTAFGTLDQSERTVGEIFKQAKYSTFRVSHNFAKVFERNIHGLGQGFSSNTLVCSSDKEPDCDAEILKESIAAIDRIAEQKTKFFGWVFFSSPHYPYLNHYTDMPDSTPLDKFRQEIRFSDEHIGKLLDYLKKKGLWDNTIVIVMGDHGEELEEHGRKYHNSLYREVTNVATIVHIPGIDGHRIKQPTSTVYVFPWLFLKGKPVFSIPARRRMKMDFGPVMSRTDGAVISEILGKDRMEIAIIQGNHRIYADMVSGFYELYDLKNDPLEKKDIYDDTSPLSIRYRGYVDNFMKVRAARLKTKLAEDKPKPPKKKPVARKTKPVPPKKKEPSVSPAVPSGEVWHPTAPESVKRGK